MDHQKWINLVIVLALASFLAVLEVSPDSLYKTLKDWQTFLAGIIGFAALTWATYAGMAANRARDDRLRKEEARALAAALAAELQEHFTTWQSIRDSSDMGAGFPPLEFTMYQAHASKIGLLGVIPTQIVVQIAGQEASLQHHLQDELSKGAVRPSALTMGIIVLNISWIETCVQYLATFAYTGIWPPRPEFESAPHPDEYSAGG